MFAFDNNQLCSIPAFFYPTTVILVDDQAEFTKTTSLALRRDYKTACFTDPTVAATYLSTNSESLFKGKKVADQFSGNVRLFRNEIYNPKRFDGAFTTVMDYDMPDKDGFDVMQAIGSNDYKTRNIHSYLLLTAKPYEAFAEKIKNTDLKDNVISKWDPNCIEQLSDRIGSVFAHMFQSCSYGVATFLSHDIEENTSFLFDGNFLCILNPYLAQHQICEGYLFDKQGSLFFLDRSANPSWLFVRNEQGIKNSIRLAKQYHAPAAILDALESKRAILSLYEQQDFESRKIIEWDRYLLPAQVFKDESKPFPVFNHRPSDYYYAFTHDFPGHGIEKNRVLSYAQFLEQR